MRDWLESAWNSIETLGRVNFWAQLLGVITVGLGALFGIIALLTSFRKDALAKVEDQKREERIVNAQAVANNAQRDTAALNLQAKGLEDDLQQSHNKQIQLELQLEQRRAENNAIALKLEAERRERIELEKVLSDRSFGDKQMEVWKALERFAKTAVVIDTMPDAECIKLSRELAFVLSQADWKLRLNPSSEVPGYFDGVSVELHNQSGRPAHEAADALTAELNRIGVLTQRHPTRHAAPHDTVFVRIGKRPSREFIKRVEELREREHRAAPLQ
jgi:outer membrane PBP1 activator LpoA protein